MPRPSRKRTVDAPTSNDPEDLACQGKLPRNTTVAEDVTVAPRSAKKRTSPLDGDETNNRATSSKTEEATSEKPARKKRAAPNTTPSEHRSGSLRSSRKRAGDFNDFDGGEFESVAIDDTPTETKSTKPSKKRKTTKRASENPYSIASADQVETEKIFPGGDRVEVKPATSSKRGRKPGKRVEKSEALPTELVKSPGKLTESKTSEKPLDGGKQPPTSDDRDEEPIDLAKDKPKRRGRPRKSQVESTNDVQSAEPTGLQTSISANDAIQNLPKTGKSKRSAVKEPATKEPTIKGPAEKESAEKESPQKVPASKSSASKASASKTSATRASASKASASKEPASEASASKVSASKASASKDPASKDPASKDPAKNEPITKNTVTKDSAKKDSAKKEPAKKEPAKKELAKKEPAKKEPAKKEPAKKEPARKEPAKKESTTNEPAKKESTTNEPAIKASASKEPALKASASKTSASKASDSKASVSKASATKKSAIEEPATEERATGEPAAEGPVTEEPDTAEFASTKSAPKASKRVTKGEKAGKIADFDASAASKISRGRKANKAADVAESSKDGPKPQASIKATDSAKTNDAAKGTRSGSGEVASSSKDVDPTGPEIPKRSGNDVVTSLAPNSKKRKTPPGADADAIREVIDPLSELESTKKKQRKELPTPLTAAKTKIGDLVSPIVDTVTHGVHTAKDLAAEVQSSILEDVAAVAEEPYDTNVDKAGTFKEPGEPAAKNDKNQGKDRSKGKEKEKEGVRALSKEAESAQTPAEDVALTPSKATPEYTKQDEQHLETSEQAQTSLTGLDDGTKEPADLDNVTQEHSRPPYQSTLVEVSGISTVCTTVVQGGQL